MKKPDARSTIGINEELDTQGHESETRWLEWKIVQLESRIEELERENFVLKESIGSAIKSLETQNSEARKIIYGSMTSGNISNGENFKSYFKPTGSKS